MVIKRRKKKPRSRKPWELGSEGEETSDGSSSEKVCVCVFSQQEHKYNKNQKNLRLSSQITKTINGLVSVWQDEYMWLSDAILSLFLTLIHHLSILKNTISKSILK